ncbi:hypothetical protein AXG93_638s1500 [Marchantia polymorpha subsp. ruderalis]|uniref:Uncharacterized protein n=1 Tax=Marchantia polymorpha subsp. ruderalis TaxID=1480154 RepID=A0A176W559_MARPO|nr:hypothetical protein AXG93_638s1500 [Marchantia polymorpha subsp. ruderalis]
MCPESRVDRTLRARDFPEDMIRLQSCKVARLTLAGWLAGWPAQPLLCSALPCPSLHCTALQAETFVQKPRLNDLWSENVLPKRSQWEERVWQARSLWILIHYIRPLSHSSPGLPLSKIRVESDAGTKPVHHIPPHATALSVMSRTDGCSRSDVYGMGGDRALELVFPLRLRASQLDGWRTAIPGGMGTEARAAWPANRHATPLLVCSCAEGASIGIPFIQKRRRQRKSEHRPSQIVPTRGTTTKLVTAGARATVAFPFLLLPP